MLTEGDAMSKQKFTYTRKVRRDECPHLMTDDMQRRTNAIIKKFGNDDPFVRSMIYGEFSPPKESVHAD